jgi:hypothetical protein
MYYMEEAHMKIKLGNFVLCKMDAQEYNKMYDANVQEQYGENINSIVWLEQYNEQGEIISMSEENMLVFEDNTFAYTSRHTQVKANIFKCLEVIRWMEEL